MHLRAVHGHRPAQGLPALVHGWERAGVHQAESHTNDPVSKHRQYQEANAQEGEFKEEAELLGR